MKENTRVMLWTTQTMGRNLQLTFKSWVGIYNIEYVKNKLTFGKPSFAHVAIIKFIIVYYHINLYSYNMLYDIDGGQWPWPLGSAVIAR